MSRICFVLALPCAAALVMRPLLAKPLAAHSVPSLSATPALLDISTARTTAPTMVVDGLQQMSLAIGQQQLILGVLTAFEGIATFAVAPGSNWKYLPPALIGAAGMYFSYSSTITGVADDMSTGFLSGTVVAGVLLAYYVLRLIEVLPAPKSDNRLTAFAAFGCLAMILVDLQGMSNLDYVASGLTF